MYITTRRRWDTCSTVVLESLEFKTLKKLKKKTAANIAQQVKHRPAYKSFLITRNREVISDKTSLSARVLAGGVGGTGNFAFPGRARLPAERIEMIEHSPAAPAVLYCKHARMGRRVPNGVVYRCTSSNSSSSSKY